MGHRPVHRPALVLALCLSAVACAGDGAPPGDAPLPPEAHAATAAAIPYALDRPDAAFALPPELQEISGLTALGDAHLGAVQDEDGVLYVLDRETAQVVARHPFHDDGDYEGIEAVGEAVWVLRSDGTLYEVTERPDGTRARTRYGTPLGRACDAEGLGYDAAGGRLLIACKEEPGPELGRVRAIYGFALGQKRLSSPPAALLDRRRLDGAGSFKPSAVAVHPRSGRIYVISSVRKALAVLEPDGRLVAALALPDRLYPQPEGLAFFPDGTLFIASEGGAGAATLLRFSEVTP